MNIRELVNHKIFVLQSNNELHDNLMNNFIKHNKLIKKSFESITDKNLIEYQRNSLMATKTLIEITINKYDDMDIVSKELNKIKFKKNLVSLKAENKEVLNKIKTIEVKGQEMFIFPKIATWKDKYDYIFTILESYNTSNIFKDYNVLDILVRLLIRDSSKWQDVFEFVELAKESKLIIDLEILQVYFKDIEFYNFNEFLKNILVGNSFKKTMVMANYYVDIKKYSINWIVKKLREELINVCCVEQGYRKGIINLQVQTLENVRERGEFENWKLTDKIARMKKQEFRRYSSIIKEISYKQLVEIEQYLFSKDVGEYVNSTLELYSIINHMYNIAKKYKKDGDFKYGNRRKKQTRSK